MNKFKDIDPFTYKRKDKTLNPYEYIKLKQAHSGAKYIPFETFKQAYLEKKYDIPSESTLERLRNQKEMFKESVVENKVGDQPQKWKHGYEFKILK